MGEAGCSTGLDLGSTSTSAPHMGTIGWAPGPSTARPMEPSRSTRARARMSSCGLASRWGSGGSPLKFGWADGPAADQVQRVARPGELGSEHRITVESPAEGILPRQVKAEVHMGAVIGDPMDPIFPLTDLG